jgi:hypothetical protein
LYTLLNPEARALHARVALRFQHGREPSPDEVIGWLAVNKGRPQILKGTEIAAALSAGEEVRLVCTSASSIRLISCVYAQAIAFEAVRCLAYDVDLARKMQVMDQSM